MECDSLGFYTSASAIYSDDEKTYVLTGSPLSSAHKCAPSSTRYLIKECMSTMKEKIHQNPTAKIPPIYDEVVLRCTEKLTDEEKITFSSEMPDFRSIKASLYRISIWNL